MPIAPRSEATTPAEGMSASRGVDGGLNMRERLAQQRRMYVEAKKASLLGMGERDGGTAIFSGGLSHGVIRVSVGRQRNGSLRASTFGPAALALHAAR
jgi:hypothetical protein